MTNVIRKATNKFTKGLVMDFSPENTQNELLTNALNATLLTFNGNELSLQNDMGNARVETAYLPEGYIPVGTCEYGGIIYIVSYNPLENKSQIGCFPSPERNVTLDEIGQQQNQIIQTSDFQEGSILNGKYIPSGKIKNTTSCVTLRNDNLNPGDKFIIHAEQSIYNELLQDLQIKPEGSSEYQLINNPIIALNIVSIEDSGRIVYLNSDVVNYEAEDVSGNLCKYHILGKGIGSNLAQNDIDSYRNTLSSGYSVFKSKTSGKLAILAELITIDSYSVTYSIKKKYDKLQNELPGEFDVILHTEVLPNLTLDNYTNVPKLKYYYLKNSQGYMQIADTKYSLFKDDEFTINPDFLNLTIKDCVNEYSDGDLTLQQAALFDFPFQDTYHGKKVLNNDAHDDESFAGNVYTKFKEGQYHRIHKNQIATHSTVQENNAQYEYYTDTLGAEFRWYDSSGSMVEVTDTSTVDPNVYVYYYKETKEEYIDAKRDETFKSQQLYKSEAEYLIINDPSIAKDESIEKFAYQSIEMYKKATTKQIEEGENIWYKEILGDEEGWKQLIGPAVVGVTYYIKSQESILISLGFVDASVYQGDIYYVGNTYNYIKVEDPQEILDYWDTELYPLTSAQPWGFSEIFYYKETKEEEVAIPKDEVQDYINQNVTIYCGSNYPLVDNFELFDSDLKQMFVIFPKDIYLSDKLFVPSIQYNYIQGKEDLRVKGPQEPAEGYPKDDPIQIYTIAEFIPGNINNNDDNYLKYNDVKLASIKIPEDVVNNHSKFPFIYDFTLVPCMNYGRLDHLAVSNTINFSNLYDFDSSNVTTWKYRIDGNQLRLSIGSEVFDINETNKVDALILEFYDLWGFAGSLYIEGKSSYSGTFTKILTLDTLNMLSTKHIVNGKEENDFYRNIAIQKTSDDLYQFNNLNITFDERKGWIDEDGNGIESDCGTLYSNILYGVKVYLRQNDGSENYTYTPLHNTGQNNKKSLFLFTSPILNDLYYKVDDFSTQGDIKLDFVLTYRLEDQSNRYDYISENFNKGYSTQEDEQGNSDHKLITNYVNGNLSDRTSLTATKYYTYRGQSKLFLELALKEGYNQYNLSCHSDINNYYKCCLQIVSEDPNGNPFFIKSRRDPNLQQSDILIPDLLKENTIYFDYETSKRQLDIDNLRPYNFLTRDYGIKPEFTHILLTYRLLVSYLITVSNIRSVNIPATTVCALCHKQPDETYNYEDFGVYKSQDEYGNTIYLSNACFYNEGDINTSIVGICRQTYPKNETDIRQSFVSVSSLDSEVKAIKTPGKLNSGEILKELQQYIGKLTFCQPHLHALSEEYGVNIYNKYTAESHEWVDFQFLGGAMPKDSKSENGAGAFHDDAQGTIPMRRWPYLNMCANTLNSMKHQNEFISAVPYGLYQIESTDKYAEYFFGRTGNGISTSPSSYGFKTVKTRKYSGLDFDNLITFNSRLIRTMSSVYAYNPDYTSLQVYMGNAVIQDNQPQFTSNIINTHSELKDLSNINDYVYIGAIKVSDYLQYLNVFSRIPVTITSNGKTSPYPQVTFQPNFRYCGTEERNSLVTPLVYNIPEQKDLYTDLQVDNSEKIIVKHADGSNTMIKGEIKKNSLYGFKDDTLVELDVKNYEIDTAGNLSLKMILETTESFELTPVEISSLITSGGLTRTIKLDNGETANVSIYLTSYSGRNGGYFIDPTNNNGSVYLVQIPDINSGSNTFEVNLQLQVKCSDSSVKINNIQCECTWLSDCLVLPKTHSNNTPTTAQITQWLDNGVVDTEYYIGRYIIGGSTGTISTYDAHGAQVPVSQIEGVSGGPYYIVQLFPTKISFDVTKNIEIQANESQVVNVEKTKNYSQISNGVYSVKNKYKKSQLQLTSMTLNDLVYEPNKDSHRLFVKNGLYQYNIINRPKIYYRYRGEEFKGVNNAVPTTVLDSWDYTGKANLNCLYLYTGPCFEPTNQ